MAQVDLTIDQLALDSENPRIDSAASQREALEKIINYYTPEDHQLIAETVKQLDGLNWVVSYDDVPEIRDLYGTFEHVSYQLGYSAREVKRGREVMFFSPQLDVPSMSPLSSG